MQSYLLGQCIVKNQNPASQPNNFLTSHNTSSKAGFRGLVSNFTNNFSLFSLLCIFLLTLPVSDDRLSSTYRLGRSPNQLARALTQPVSSYYHRNYHEQLSQVGNYHVNKDYHG